MRQSGQELTLKVIAHLLGLRHCTDSLMILICACETATMNCETATKNCETTTMNYTLFE